MRLIKTIYGLLGGDKETISFISGLSFGQAVEIKGGVKKSRRSTLQNAYYWGVVLKTLSEELSKEAENIHTALKIGCFGAKSVDVCGMVLTVPKKSTKELTTAEFEDYLSWVREWASINRGIYIPLPNEMGYYDESQ